MSKVSFLVFFRVIFIVIFILDVEFNFFVFSCSIILKNNMGCFVDVKGSVLEFVIYFVFFFVGGYCLK